MEVDEPFIVVRRGRRVVESGEDLTCKQEGEKAVIPIFISAVRRSMRACGEARRARRARKILGVEARAEGHGLGRGLV